MDGDKYMLTKTLSISTLSIYICISICQQKNKKDYHHQQLHHHHYHLCSDKIAAGNWIGNILGGNGAMLLVYSKPTLSCRDW